MASLSTKLDLILDSTADQFKTADFVSNWGKVDAAPGAVICTSSTRPTWATGKTGRRIYETDTGLLWFWDGAVWQRTGGKGLLTYVERTTPLTITNSTTIVVMLSATSVVIPDGHRPLRVEMKIPGGTKTAGSGNSSVMPATLNQSAVAGTGPILSAIQLSYSSYTIKGGNYTADIPAGLNAGTYNFSIQVQMNEATCTGTIFAGTQTYSAFSSPSFASLSVVEL